MTIRRTTSRLLTALCFSAAVHGVALSLTPAIKWSPLADMAWSEPLPQDQHPPEPSRRPEDQSQPEPEPAPKPEEPEKVRLGIDADTPDSPNWLGGEQYKVHLAAPAEVDQPAWTDEPMMAGASEESGNPGEPAPRGTAAEAQIQTPAPEQPPIPTAMTFTLPGADANSKRDAANDSAPLPAPLHEAAIAQATDSPLDVKPNPELPSDPVEPLARAEDANTPELTPPPPVTQVRVPEVPPLELSAMAMARKAAEQSPSEAPQKAQGATTGAEAPQADPAVAAALAAVRGVANPGSGGSGGPVDDPGERADAEADPTSVVDVPRDQWQLGKPLAARGLTIKPRRPTFTILQTVTASPGNPLCLIRFDRTGKPTEAEIVQSCGDSRIDSAIRASLYRWRAEGKPLAKLADDETIDITIRIVLTYRKRS